ANASTLHDALFYKPVAPDDMRRYLRASQPESHRAIWDMTLFNLPMRSRMAPTPLLVLGAEHDQLIPPSEVRSTGASYNVGVEIFPDMGHAMMLEDGWEPVAERIRDWLQENLAD
ncbi:MAG TPA: alpha/beta hydrolase, partial [Denitromonas sp.]|nr:alpha/beta hydrolase [Denitromonas sp.]